MAFIKKCISTVLKCAKCGKPAIKQTSGKEYAPEWLCLDCLNKSKK